ncbi:MAG: PASTA domain-containing protein, partial [Acidimicrobiia bacterium]|nr:PASTA domain-containing protein [Acidimicrobiia bacterium]
GVDLKAVMRALVVNVEAGEIVQGGSTITQQYLKNTVLTPDVTLDRKVEEAVLSIRLEESLTKEEILERYLNTVYFGSGAYGVGTAAEVYFGKRVSDLTLGEAALLAGLIRRPTRTDPFLYPDAAVERRKVVLDKLVELEWIDQQTADDANAEPVVLNEREALTQAKFPHFVEEVKRRLLDDPQLGATATDRYNALFRGGLHIHTTIDPMMQESAELSMADVLGDQEPSGALVAIDPRTGHVLAMVGGRGFYDPENPVAQFNLATQGKRQAGSSFKPFVLAAALESGIGTDTVLRGGSTVTVETDSGPWTVSNFDGSVFPDLTVTEATVFSVNVAYAQLIDAVGPRAVERLAEAAGITTDLQPYHSLALGAQEVSVLDMASAYSTFASGGTHIEPVLVTRIDNSDGVNVWEANPAVTPVLDRVVADEVTATLSEVVKRGTGQQARIGRPIAGKTGTSDDHADAWFVGYTPELVAAVWVGFPEGRVAMEHPRTPFTITGGFWPANIWSRFASAALSGVPYGQLATDSADGNTTVEVDLSTGFLAGPLCPREHVARIQMPADLAPTVICPIHNPEGIIDFAGGLVPDVIGDHLSHAVEILTASEYQVAVVWSDGGPLAQGTIFGQSPNPGDSAQAGSVVRLTVAGPDPNAGVPSVLGYPEADALQRMAEAGLVIEVLHVAEADELDARRRSGMVWKQEPPAGSESDGVVTVWVNP